MPAFFCLVLHCLVARQCSPMPTRTLRAGGFFVPRTTAASVPLATRYRMLQEGRLCPDCVELMKLPRIRTLLLVPVVAFVAFYLLAVLVNVSNDETVAPAVKPRPPETIAIFGASGTAGDGILKAALADPYVRTIHVITRRITPRMKEGIEAGRVVATTHTDYLDYAAVIALFTNVEAVFWAIGISSLKVDEETYGLIHVDFPVAFLEAWLEVNELSTASFHYISSSDISEDSSAHWAREKVRAENALFGIADGTAVRVIAYRPDYIGPTREEANLGQKALYGFFAPAGVAVKARQIGEAMLETSARGSEFENGDKLYTGKIIRYSNAYLNRVRRDQAPSPTSQFLASSMFSSQRL